MAEGIDVYGKYQAVTSWAKVKEAGKEFVYVKLSDGNTDRDDYGYVHQAQSAGLRTGGYHYAQFGDPVAQSDRLLRRCEEEGAFDLAPALDIESPFSPDSIAVDFAQRFIDEITASGNRFALYGNDTMMQYLIPRLRLGVGVKWIARYSSSGPRAAYDVWQYSSSGAVPGIVASGVDLNKGGIPLNTKTVISVPTSGDNVPVVIPVPPGKNVHVSIPCEAVPHFFYVHTSYGDKFSIRQIDFVRPTSKISTKPDYVPGKGFHCGDDGLGNGGTPWNIDASRPGPVVDFTSYGAVTQVDLRADNYSGQLVYVSIG